MNIWDCACKYCNDLKVSAQLCGIMAGWPKFPCPYCEAPQEKLDTLGQMRTIESLFQHYEDYEQHCRHLNTVKQKKDACKEHVSVETKPLLAKTKDSKDAKEWVLFKMPPDELHHLTGPFGKLYKSCKKYNPKIEEWSTEVCFQKSIMEVLLLEVTVRDYQSALMNQNGK